MCLDVNKMASLHSRGLQSGRGDINVAISQCSKGHTRCHI